jgi:hypothetical protein
MDNGEYLLFGHDGGQVSAWTTSEVPGTLMQRITREWRVDRSGDPGTVTVSIDTGLFAARPAGYDQMVLMIDSDGDFSNGATQVPLSLSSGEYVAGGVNIPDGAFLSVGIFKPEISFTQATSNGLESDTPASITVDLNYSLGSDLDIDYTVTGGSATGGGTDYTLADATLTIPAGNTSASFDITVIDDAIVESDETIIIELSRTRPLLLNCPINLQDI